MKVARVTSHSGGPLKPMVLQSAESVHSLGASHYQPVNLHGSKWKVALENGPQNIHTFHTLVYNEKRRGPRTEPCGIPVKMVKGGVKCDCRVSVVLCLTISPPRRETPGSIPTSTKKIHDIYSAIWGKILCLAAICAAGWFSCMVVPESIVWLACELGWCAVFLLSSPLRSSPLLRAASNKGTLFRYYSNRNMDNYV